MATTYPDETDYWLIGGNGWSKVRHTYRKALALSKTMVNCVDCVDSDNCTNCINCEFCTNCTDCSYCGGCKGCVSCKSLQCSRNSIDMVRAYNCTNCVSVHDLWDLGLERLDNHAGSICLIDYLIYIK